MDIHIAVQDNICTMSLAGRMDATTVTRFEEACKENLAKGYERILVDMNNLEYISSAGLRGILLMEKMSKTHNCTIVFYGLQQMVQEVFKISGFNAILKICESHEDALKK